MSDNETYPAQCYNSNDFPDWAVEQTSSWIYYQLGSHVFIGVIWMIVMLNCKPKNNDSLLVETSTTYNATSCTQLSTMSLKN